MAKKLLFNNVIENSVDNKVYLYNRGDLCTSVTGGWIPSLNSNITFESDHIKMVHYELNYVDTVNKFTFQSGDTIHVIAMVDNPPYEGAYFLGVKIDGNLIVHILTDDIKATYGYNNVFELIGEISWQTGDREVRISGYYSNFNIYEIYIVRAS